jgi:hypothetical protein
MGFVNKAVTVRHAFLALQKRMKGMMAQKSRLQRFIITSAADAALAPAGGGGQLFDYYLQSFMYQVLCRHWCLVFISLNANVAEKMYIAFFEKDTAKAHSGGVRRLMYHVLCRHWCPFVISLNANLPKKICKLISSFLKRTQLRRILVETK